MTNQQENNWEERFYILTRSMDGQTRPELLLFIRDLLNKQREEMNDCTCKEKWTFGVVHRKDNPCYWPPRGELIPPLTMTEVGMEMETEKYVDTIVERIVILYANLSGRESANRAEFRDGVRKLLLPQMK